MFDEGSIGFTTVIVKACKREVDLPINIPRKDVVEKVLKSPLEDHPQFLCRFDFEVNIADSSIVIGVKAGSDKLILYEISSEIKTY